LKIEHKELIQEFFDQIDVNKTGHITREGMTKAMKSNNKEEDPIEIDQIVQEVDQNNTNKISFHEFVQVT
jgi:Ca2+-binding EF-hand superfamily protein